MPLRRSLRFFCVAALALLIACASTDAPFSQASLDSIVLGTTRYEEVLAMLGTPQRDGVSQVNGQTIDTVSWLHASGKKRRTHRYVSVQFWNGVAVGLLYNSTFEDDKTDFDEAKVAQIVEGHTRIDEVKALLGDPPGRLVYPLVEDQQEKGLLYVFVDMRPSRFHSESLKVFYGPDGVVTDVEFASSKAVEPQ